MARISDLRFVRSNVGDGLLGFTSFILDGDVLIDGVAVRRTIWGELTLSWPARKDTRGRLHHHVRPVDDEARLELEGELLAQLHPFVRGGAA
jgi:DNA-binding cell septation regulator SpoVG